jgi:hypothetical protein
MKDDDLQPICGNCRFYRTRPDDGDSGHCHAHPPVAVAFQYGGGTDIQWLSPWVGHEDACGEFQAKG